MVVASFSSEIGRRLSNEGRGDTIESPSGMYTENGDFTCSFLKREIVRDQQICGLCQLTDY